MISLSLNTAFMLYLGLLLGALFSLWIYQHVFSRRNKLQLIDRELFICEYCHFAYLEERSKQVTRCPLCQSFNKFNSYREKHGSE